MKKNKLPLLLAITIIAVAAAILVTQKQTPTTERERPVLFPEFKQAINAVGEITVQRGKQTITLSSEAEGWKIKEADDYPALFSKIKQTVIAVSELRVISEKTKNPDQYSTLGVEDPAADKAGSSLMTIKDKSGDQLTALIVGKRRLSSAAADDQGLYVRVPGQDQTLLVAGNLDVSVEPADWLEKNLINISSDRIRQIDIRHGSEQDVSLRREHADDNLVPEKIPAGKQARTDYAMERMEGILEDITIDNVMAESKITFPADSVITTVRTTDGLTAVITSAVIDEKNYAKFAFQYNVPEQPAAEIAPAVEAKTEESKPEQQADSAAEGEKEPEPKRDVAKETADLTAKTAGWAYQIPAYKFDTFTRKLEDLIEAIPEKKPESAGDKE
jgi:hypothetical protein